MPKLTQHNRVRIQALYNTGMNISQLSRDFKVTRNTIKKWINRSKNMVSDENRSGRPPKVSRRLSRTLKREIQQDNSLRRLAMNHSLSHETIRRHLVDCPNPLFPYKVKSILKLSTSDKRKRIDFCKKYESTDITKWTFVDEKPFQLFQPPNKQNKRSWRRRSAKNTVTKYNLVKHPKKIHMFAAINMRGKSKLRWYLKEQEEEEKNGTFIKKFKLIFISLFFGVKIQKY